jgi:hypothetical protein
MMAGDEKDLAEKTGSKLTVQVTGIRQTLHKFQFHLKSQLLLIL